MRRSAPRRVSANPLIHSRATISFRAEYSMTSYRVISRFRSSSTAPGIVHIQFIVREDPHPGLSKGLVKEDCIVNGRPRTTRPAPGMSLPRRRGIRRINAPKCVFPPEWTLVFPTASRMMFPDPPLASSARSSAGRARIVEARKCSRRVSDNRDTGLRSRVLGSAYLKHHRELGTISPSFLRSAHKTASASVFRTSSLFPHVFGGWKARPAGW